MSGHQDELCKRSASCNQVPKNENEQCVDQRGENRLGPSFERKFKKPIQNLNYYSTNSNGGSPFNPIFRFDDNNKVQIADKLEVRLLDGLMASERSELLNDKLERAV